MRAGSGTDTQQLIRPSREANVGVRLIFPKCPDEDVPNVSGAPEEVPRVLLQVSEVLDVSNARSTAVQTGQTTGSMGFRVK